ncbi:MAG: hypothetical protein CL600_15450 [Alteromonas sp.]|nr:hypothetical protein [Alteromonas sp.]
MIDNFNHAHTPLFLKKLNAKLADNLKVQERNDSDEHLKRLVTLRHKLVMRALRQLPSSKLSSFAKNELTVNEFLEDVIKELRSQVKNNLVELSRAKKAAKSYE